MFSSYDGKMSSGSEWRGGQSSEGSQVKAISHCMFLFRRGEAQLDCTRLELTYMHGTSTPGRREQTHAQRQTATATLSVNEPWQIVFT